MNRIHSGGSLPASRDIRLIRDENECKSERFEHAQGLRRIRNYADFVRGPGRVRSSVSNDSLIQDAIAIQENGSIQRADSHFVSACLTVGCETSKCQTTAWNASA